MLMENIMIQRLLLFARIYFIQYEQMVSHLDKLYFQTKEPIPCFIEDLYYANYVFSSEHNIK